MVIAGLRSQLWLVLASALALGGCHEQRGAPGAATASPRARAVPSAPPPPPPASARAEARAPAAEDRVADVWSSREECLRRVGAGERMPKRTGSARIGSWNVRWFPDGKPGKRPAAEGGVDLEWLACAIAYLNVDALAVQEMKATPHARQALDRVLASLGRHMGGKWQTELDACDNLAGQHVGVLWNTARARAKPGVVLPSLNAHGEACKDQLRPGMSVHLDFGPLDFHLVSVHAKSGTKRRDLELRARALAGLDAARRVLAATDEDVIVAGDFNTMGCRHCSPRVEAARELEDFDRALAAQSAPLVRLPASEACSQAYGPHGALLDHILVSARLFPRVVAGRATISGFCAAEACRLARQPPAESALSDHCPVLVDITLGP